MRASVKRNYWQITAILAVVGFVFYSGIFASPTQAATGTNPQMNYQGRLLDSAGAVVADGLYNMEFKVYQDGDGCVPGGSSPCSGTLEWTESRIQTNRVTVRNGYFSVNLGSVTAFGTSVDWNQDTLWLSINIGGTTNTPTPTWDGEMTAFKRLTSTPYAFNSSQLGGLQAANFVQLAQGVQTDTSIANSSIFINKNNASLTPNIVQLQKAGSDVFVLDNTGKLSLQPSTDGDALVVKNRSAGKEVFTVDTTNNQIVLGKAGAGNINGKVLFNTATASNFTVGLQSSGSTTASYNLTLPTALPGSTQCLQSDNAGILSFVGCTATPAFSAVGAGTNTNALVIGTGGSLGVTGSGTIGATSLSANYVASIANGTGLTGGAAGSNAAALTLGIDQTASLTWTGTEAFNGATSFAPSGTNDITLTLDADSFLIAAGDSINEFAGDGLIVTTGSLGLRLDTTAADGASTTSVSGLEIVGGEVSLIRGCANGDVLKWDNTNFDWDCAADSGAGASPFNTAGGVITKATAGDYLSLRYGDAGDTQLVIENTTNNVIPTVDGMQIELTGNTTGIVTNGVDGLQISAEFGNGTANTNSLLHLTANPVAASGDETFYGLNIDGLTPTAAAESAINIGAGWDTGVRIATSAAATGINIAASAAPTVDMFNITNTGQGVATAGVSGLQLTYVGGAAAVEASAQRIDLTGGTTAAGTWNGMQIVQGTITPGTTVQDIKLETAALTSTSGATVINGINLATAGAINNSTAGSINWSAMNVTTPNVTQGAGGTATATGVKVTLGTLTTGGTQYGINITGSSSNAAGTEVGLNISSITGGAASETGIEVGSGWDTAIKSNGNVVLGARTDATAGSYTLTNSAAGTFGGETAITGVTGTAVYKGKLFAAVSKTDLAGVYRYDGGTTWTLVTGGTVGPTSPGKVLTGDTANVDSFVITVFNNQLVIGTRTGASVAAVFTSTNADTGTAATTTWTQINTTKGTFATGCTNACSTVIDGVDDIAVYNGSLYIISQETNAMEVYRYQGGTGASVFIKISDIAGEILTADATDGDGGVFAVYGSRLYVGIKTGSTTGRVFYYTGTVNDQTSAGTWVLLNTTRGTFTTGTTGEPDVVSMTVFNGSLWMATGRTNLANVYKLKGGFEATAGASPFQKMTSTSGKIITADTANIDSIALKSYQGRLYVGTSTGAGTNTGAVYEYDSSLAVGSNFTLIGTRGTFGAQTNVDDVTSLQPMNIANNGAFLYVGTNDSGNVGSVYEWFKFASQSYGLRMDSGSSNIGAIIFTADDQASDNNGRLGKFVFSHSVNFAGGAFDYAEDYPTFDTSLVPGHPVSVDPNYPDHVKLASPGETVLGIVSENPGMRLTSEIDPSSGASWVPIALTGRVPVSVTGVVSPGDKLSLSDIPGVLKKAEPGKDIVGSALSGHGGEGQGRVSMYVNPQWSDAAGAFVADTVAQAAGLNLSTGKEYNSAIFNILGSDGSSVASIDSEGNATFAGTVTADKIKANQIEGIEIITNQISSLQAQLDKTKPGAAAGSSPPPTATGKSLNLDDMTAVNLVAMAQLSVKGGLSVDKDAKFNGKTVFQLLAEFNGPAKFNGEVSFNSDAGGTALIKKDFKKVNIKFSKEYSSAPIITANYFFKGANSEADQESLQRLLDGGYNFVVSQTTTKGFSIVLNKPATEDITFTWLATLINSPQLSQNQEVPVASGN